MAKLPRVDVTEAIIERACQADSSHCMIAEAIKEQLPDVQHVAVDLQTIRYTRTGTGRRYIVLTPPSAQLAIIEFDQGRAVPPFSVTLKPAQIVKSNRSKRSASTKASPRKRAIKEPAASEAAASQGAILEGPALVPESTEPTFTRQLARPEHGGPGSVPTVIGGDAPPLMDKAAHSRGKRRQFGLRSLER
jgi:hypothetical protein